MIKNDNGETELTIPIDRKRSYDLIIIKKYERTLGPFEDEIISRYAKGMTTIDIQSNMKEFYDLDFQ
ncbi:MAG: transposase [Stygiobacter sp.]